jgi:hypothetical protein
MMMALGLLLALLISATPFLSGCRTANTDKPAPRDWTAARSRYQYQLKEPAPDSAQPEESIPDAARYSVPIDLRGTRYEGFRFLMDNRTGLIILDLRGTRYDGLYIPLSDVPLIADITAIEARGEPFEGQTAVPEVIFNRCLSPDFPDTPREVIFDRRYCIQFTSILSLGKVEAADKQYAAVARALYGPHILPADVIYFSGGGENSREWGTIGGHTFCYR